MSIDTIETDFDIEDSEGVMLSVRIVQDDESEYYERRVYSLLDLFSQLGGVYELMRLSVGFTIGYFTKKFMMYSVFNHIYFVEEKRNYSDHYNSKNQALPLSKVHNKPSNDNKNLASTFRNSSIPSHVNS